MKLKYWPDNKYGHFQSFEETKQCKVDGKQKSNLFQFTSLKYYKENCKMETHQKFMSVCYLVKTFPPQGVPKKQKK